MVDEDDDEQPVTPKQAFAGLQKHANDYKSYLQRLKYGAKSGISHIIGTASDLLPTEALDSYKRGTTGYQVGENVVKGGLSTALMNNSIDQLAQAAHIGADQVGRSARELGQSIDGRTIIGVVLVNGKKMLMFEDFSLEEAPAWALTNAQTAVVWIAPEDSAALAEALAEEPAASNQATSLSASQPPADTQTALTQPVPGDESREPVPHDTAISQLQSASASSYESPRGSDPSTGNASPSNPLNAEITTMPPSDPPTGNASPSAPHSQQQLDSAEVPIARGIRVRTKDGRWLWDITLLAGEPVQILLADGTLIRRTKHDKFVLTGPNNPGENVPNIEIISSLIMDPRTGNLFYQDFDGKQAIALINSGWRLEQLKSDEGSDDRYLLTELFKTGDQVKRNFPVGSITIDSDSNITCVSSDGEETILIESHPLVSD